MLPDGPNVTFHEERMATVLPELEACWKAHWNEIAQDKDRMPLDPDYTLYQTMDELGILHIVTARVDDELAGYYISFVRPHLHYKSTLCAYADLYYLKPAFRRGWLGVRLFRAAETFLRARGVSKLFASTKVYADQTPLFQRRGWVETERTYSKWIGTV